MEIPRNDTPTLDILAGEGFGGLQVDRVQISACLDLLRVAKRTLGFFYQRFEAHNISPGEYSVLMELLGARRDAAPTPSEIARRIGLSRPSLTNLVERLVRNELVERRTDERDRRRIELHLTRRGRAFLERFLPGQMATMARVVTDLSPTQITRLRKALGVVEKNVERLQGELS